MNKVLEDYLNELRTRMAAMPLRERETVLEEIEQHLRDKAAALCESDDLLSEDEAFLQATQEFGDADEIGIDYGPDGGVVRQSTGERLLDVAILTGRGIGRGVGTVAMGAGGVVRGFLKWVGIMTVALLGAIVILGAVGLLVAPEILGIFEDDIAALREDAMESGESWRGLYNHRSAWDEPTNRSWTETFQVPTDTDYVQITLHVHATDSGCGAIRLIAPDGSTAYDSGTVCDETQTTLTQTTHGTWRVEYEAMALAGHLEARATGYSTPQNQTASS